METTRRNLLTLLSSIPALSLFGAVGGTTAKAEAKAEWHEGHKEGGKWVWNDVTQKYKNGCTDVTELPSPYPSTAWEKIDPLWCKEPCNELLDQCYESKTCKRFEQGFFPEITAWEKIERNIMSLETPPEEFKTMLALNKKIVAEHPDLFPTERIMTAPTCKLWNGNSLGQIVTEKSRSMKCEFTLEFAQDLKAICGIDPEEEIKAIMTNEMATELMRMNDLKVGEQKVGYVMCPYIPLQIVRSVDPHTYHPKIRFVTRYGVMKL